MLGFCKKSGSVRKSSRNHQLIAVERSELPTAANGLDWVSAVRVKIRIWK